MKLASLLNVALLLWAISPAAATASAFEGRIRAAIMRGEETQTVLYTVATNRLRVETLQVAPARTSITLVLEPNVTTTIMCQHISADPTNI